MTARQRERERGETERSLKLHSGCSVNSKLTHYPVASLRKRARLSLEWCRRDSTTGTKNLRIFWKKKNIRVARFFEIFYLILNFVLMILWNKIIFLSIYIVFFFYVLRKGMKVKGQNILDFLISFFNNLPFSNKKFYLYCFFFSKICCNWLCIWYSIYLLSFKKCCNKT